MPKSGMLPPEAGIGSNDVDAFARAGGLNEASADAEAQMQQAGASAPQADVPPRQRAHYEEPAKLALPHKKSDRAIGTGI